MFLSLGVEKQAFAVPNFIVLNKTWVSMVADSQKVVYWIGISSVVT